MSCIVGIEGIVGVKELWVFETERNTATHAAVSETLESRLESRLCSGAPKSMCHHLWCHPWSTV